MSAAHNPPRDDAEAQAFAIVRERAERNAAEREAALDVLTAVMQLVDRRGYMTPEHQAVVAGADALLAAAGRKIR